MKTITREQAFAISSDYVKFSEGDFSFFDKVSAKFVTLKRNQRAITYFDGEFVQVVITSIRHNDPRGIDGPVVRVSDGEYTWRVDGCRYAWPL